MRTSFNTIILLTILSCSTKDTRIVDNKPAQDVATANRTNQSKDTILLSNVVTHFFSSPIVKDTFKIKLTGQSITNGTVEFEIKTNYGLVIKYGNYPSYYLIGYGLDDNASETEKAEFIKGRIENFFNEENFRQPAISRDEEFDGDYSDKDIWDDIKSDSTAVKFEYLIAEESFGRIAYSKRRKEVVTIFSCC